MDGLYPSASNVWEVPHSMTSAIHNLHRYKMYYGQQKQRSMIHPTKIANMFYTVHTEAGREAVIQHSNWGKLLLLLSSTFLLVMKLNISTLKVYQSSVIFKEA